VAEYAPVDLDVENQVSFELDGRRVTAPAGTMLVDACYAHGVEIPIFCYEPRLGPPIGACRMCLVEVEGMRGLQTACSTPVAPDMVVRTQTAGVKEAQDGVLELLLANHPLDCPVCDKGGECPLQDRTFKFGPGRSRMIEPKYHFPKPLELSQRIALDRERCIRCYRCVRFSQDVAQDGQLTMQERGARSEITTFTGDPYDGRFTGNVIDICPVGALTSIPYRFVSRPWDVENTPSVCGLCPVGCNTEITVREGEVKRVTGRPNPNYAVEEGWLCDRGRWGYDIAGSPDRLTEAIVREASGDRAAGIEDGVAAAGELLAGGPVGILLGPSATVEEAGIALDLAAPGGALEGAIVARTGIPAAGLAPLRALPGAQLGDLDGADFVAIVGGAPSDQQPVVELRVRKAARLGATVTGCGPRPHVLEALGAFTRTAPGALADGVAALRDALAGAERPVVLWDEADLAAEPAAVAALAEALGAHAGARQLELGADVNGAGLRALGIPAAGGLLAAVREGRVAALLLVHADPLGAPGAGEWGRALEGFAGPVVAVATHPTPSSDRADVVLPALTMWEQEGTLVNMAGRAQRVRPAGHGPEGAAAGWEILVALAHRMGRPPAYRTAAAAFRHVTAGHAAFDGVHHDALGVLGAVVGPATGAGADAAAPADPGEGLPVVATAEIYGDAAAHRSHALRGAVTEPVLRLAPATAERSWVVDGDRVRLSGPAGVSGVLTVRVEEGWPEGAAFVPLGAPGAPAEGALPAGRGPVNVRIERV
jgi:NADH-quinone oxidoreductase subunit G